MARKKRIGILGGTFNPPHIGHLILAEEAMNALKLDKVIFIPAFIPPHKRVPGDDAKKRYSMVKLACAGNKDFEASDMEISKRGVSYSVYTLRRLKKKLRDKADLFFITGSDSLRELGSWKNVDELMSLSKFVVATRPGYPPSRLKKGVRLIRIPEIDISSTEIRQRVRRGLPIRYLVPEDVAAFIRKNNLYV